MNKVLYVAEDSSHDEDNSFLCSLSTLSTVSVIYGHCHNLLY